MGKSVKLPSVPIKLPSVTMPKVISDAGKAIEKGISNTTKEAGKGVGNVAAVTKDIVKDTIATTGTGVGNVISQTGRLVNDKNIIQAGSNVSTETSKGANQYSGLLTDIVGNALTGGGYGAVTSLGSLAQNQKFDPSAIASAAGSLAGYNPQLMQGLASAAKGDIRGAALAGLGGLGSAGGQSFLSSFSGGQGGSNPLLSMLSNPNALKLGTAALSGDKGGLASSLAGLSGFGDTASSLIGTAASGDMKKTALQALGSYGSQYGLSDNMQRMLTGAVGGNTRDIAMGLLGSADVMDPARLKAIDALSGGKLTMENAQTAFGGLIPSMGTSGAAGSTGGSDWLKSLQNLGSGFSTGDYIPEALQGLSTSGALPFSTSGALPFSTSGMLPGFGTNMAAGGKGSENTAAIKDYFSNMFGGGDGFQAGRAPAGTEYMPEQTGQESGGGFLNQVGSFLGNNKNLIGMGADAIAATLGYKAGQAGFEQARKQIQAQLDELKVSDKKLAGMNYDPERYKKEQQFLEDRIAGGGITAQEKQMQQQGDLRAARAGAAARLAGVEQMARMGTGATGAGSALASSLAGGQSVMGTQAETNLAREASASQRLDQDIQRRSNLSRQATSEEAALAQNQAALRQSALEQMGKTRKELGDLDLGKKVAEANLYKELAGFAKTGVGLAKSDTEKTQEQYDAEMRQLELDKKRREVYGRPAPQPTSQPAPQPTPQPAPQPTSQPVPQPAPTVKPPTPAVKPPQPNVPTQTQINNAIKDNTYTIKSGDTLGKVYKDLGYSNWQEAYAANKDLVGDNPDLIKTGNTLRPKKAATTQTATQQMNAKYTI